MSKKTKKIITAFVIGCGFSLLTYAYIYFALPILGINLSRITFLGINITPVFNAVAYLMIYAPAFIFALSAIWSFIKAFKLLKKKNKTKI